MQRLYLIYYLLKLTHFSLPSSAGSVQLDYTGTDKITSQVFTYSVTVNPMSEDSFYVRLPYPDPAYAYMGRWATYRSEGIDIKLSSTEAGPFVYEYFHYNQGYSNVNFHVSVAYWDSYGWIMIDPNFSSGFTIISRVYLGSDQDVSGVRVEFSPQYLVNYIVDWSFDCEDGYNEANLTFQGERCSEYPWLVLEHYELPDEEYMTGSEPQNCIVPVNVAGVKNSLTPSLLKYLSNYPNPFNPITVFKFSVEKKERIKLNIYSINGKLVDTVIDEVMEPGEKTVAWNCTNLASGIYIAALYSSSGVKSSRKIVVIK